ncbi:MAG: DUF3634 family protein [Polyangia bacterium]
MIRLLLLVGVLAAIVLVIWLFSRAGALFAISQRRGRARLKGTVPGRSDAEILAFVEELDLPDGARITGRRGENPFRLQMSAKVPPGAQQRIRNFLYFR